MILGIGIGFIVGVVVGLPLAVFILNLVFITTGGWR